MNISIEVNGKAQSLEVEGRTLLVEVLREQQIGRASCRERVLYRV